ncbi:hypothetical protein ACIPY6_43665 [Streptomyces sp. NPDC090054]|uniref:hypothetical protein n=1 Tax=Streptomyces sp. NPDC090054 TaxID=3365933 RepID=UPI0038181A56
MKFSSAWGSREALDAVLVRPDLVAEISADVAIDRGGVYRHPVRHVRPLAAASAPSGVLGGSNEMAGLVLLINTVLGGLGTLYGMTGSAGITLAAALLVLLIIVVVLVVRRVVAPGGGLEREDGRGGK